MGVLRLPDRSRRGTRDERAKARTTKGKRERLMPIHHALGERLKKMKRHPDGRVFHGPRVGILKPDTVRNILIRDIINPLAAQFPSPPGEPGFKDGRLHSFRHYFCSSCANAGVPEQMLMDWLGHRDSAMVKRYYHASRDEALRQMNRLQFSTLAADDRKQCDDQNPAAALVATNG
jgi:integrase